MGLKMIGRVVKPDITSVVCYIARDAKYNIVVLKHEELRKCEFDNGYVRTVSGTDQFVCNRGLGAYLVQTNRMLQSDWESIPEEVKSKCDTLKQYLRTHRLSRSFDIL